MPLMDISDVAKASGVPASTLRYYEDRALIQSVGRRGLRRLFEPGVLDILDAISLAKWAGFSLDEIAAWIGHDGRMRLDRQQIDGRAAEIETLISRLETLARMMRHTAKCPAPDHFACPTFQRMLRAAREDRRLERRKPGPRLPNRMAALVSGGETRPSSPRRSQ